MTRENMMKEYKLEDICTTSLPLMVQLMDYPYYQCCHKHNVIELVYIQRGAGWCAVNGTIHPMFTGDLYMIPIGATHEYYSYPGSGFRYVNCLFDLAIFNENEKELAEFFNGTAEHIPDKFTFGTSMQKQLMALFVELHTELMNVSRFHLIRSRALFIELAVQIIRNSRRAPGVEVTCAKEQMGRVLGYISAHPGEKLTLAKLASLSGYSPEYFGKLFRREMGTGVAEYICSRRVELACHELVHTARPVEEIAYRTGFFDASYFIKNFRKYCGMTPLQFRKKHKRSDNNLLPQQ